MTGTGAGLAWSEGEAYIDAFEEAQARDGRANIEDFLPPREHGGHLHVLCELVRIDLERGYERGEPRPLDHYRERFPDLFAHPEHASAIAYEEGRLRKQASEPASSVHPTGKRSGRSDDLTRAAWTYRSVGKRLGGDGADSLGMAFHSHAVAPEPAALFRDLHETDPDAADRLARAVTTLPRAGGAFLGFHLESELGRGAFGRVFLARQGDLAGRRVALKVSADVGREAQSLAQLQHTNIVPIYSLHHNGPLRAVCMPFLGSVTLSDILADIRLQQTLPDSGAVLLSSLDNAATTLPHEPSSGPDGSRAAEGPAGGAVPARATAQIETLRRLGYVPAILWIGRRLADGLAHAHERGILHRDLKPANILFSDGGEPVLLDFNLAADTKLPPSLAQVGGTLPYMAPEQLASFRDDTQEVDERSDLFALGIVLYELLTGRPPYPVRRGAIAEVLPDMIADRKAAPPAMRSLNRAITPAVEAIVHRCLHADPSERYQSALQLAEDLQRQLDDCPLKHTREPSLRERIGKWARRHPRLTSTTAVTVFAASLVASVVAGYVANRSHYRVLEATGSYRSVSDDLERALECLATRSGRPEQIAEGIAICRGTIERYGILGPRDWTSGPLVSSLPKGERTRLRENLGEMLSLWARAESWRAQDSADGSQRASRVALAARLNAAARSCYGAEVPRAVILQQADIAAVEGRREEADRLRKEAAAIPIRTGHDQLSTLSEILDGPTIAALRVIADRSPQDFLLWFLLGNSYIQVGQDKDAADCFGIAIALRPNHYWASFHRGVLELQHGDFAHARDDFDRVLKLQPDLSAARINRALARLGLGDARGAVADLDAALERSDAPTRAWFIRAKARDQMGDTEGAGRDRAEGLRRRPDDAESWVARGLAHLPGDPRGAIADLDAALALDPRSREALQNKSHVLSELLGRPDEAIGALDRLLRSHARYVPALGGRGVLLARQGRRDEAIRDARAALEVDTKPITLYQTAGIYALTSRSEPADRREALRLLSAALMADPKWLAEVPRDPDLDPIRTEPEFAEIIRAASVLNRMAQQPGTATER